jgi:hypothetical protein
MLSEPERSPCGPRAVVCLRNAYVCETVALRNVEHARSIRLACMREWLPSDVLEISTDSASVERARKNVISEASNNRLSIYLHDVAATPGESSLSRLPTRGRVRRQVLHVPKGSSTNHNVSVWLSEFLR